jgi:hypothetical protein
VAPSTYDGAPAIHRHYDPDGNLVGVTEIESPWDDAARSEAEALQEAEHLVCPACGNLREECADPDRLWYPQRHICYASKTREAADRMYAEKHKAAPFHSGNERGWVKDFSPKTPFHFRDGARVWVSQLDLSPDDAFI